MGYKFEGDKVYGTTQIFRSGRKYQRRGLPPKLYGRWGSFFIRGVNLRGDKYDYKSDNNWEFWKQDWTMFIKLWEEHHDWKTAIIKKVNEEWANKPIDTSPPEEIDLNKLLF